MSEEEFQRYLAAADRATKELPVCTGLPTWLQAKRISVWAHAVRLCRLAGVRRAAATELSQRSLGAVHSLKLL